MEVKIKKTYFILGIAFLWVTILAGKTWRVPSEVPTIKSAVEDSAQDNDTVLVASGTYDEYGIKIENKIVLISEKGRDSTIIDANSMGSLQRGGVFSCIDVDTAVISGFTIREGNVWHRGGGIYCSNSFLLISDNLITANYVGGGNSWGGGICGDSSSLVIENNIITDNSLLHYSGGGGIMVAYCPFVLIKNNIIADNYANSFGAGGGISCEKCSLLIIENNIITNNVANDNGWGGGICLHNCGTITRNNIITGNSAAHTGGDYKVPGGGICCYNPSYGGIAPIIEYNIVANNSAKEGGGIYASSQSLEIANNIIVNSLDGGGIFCASCSTISHNDVWNNVDGDFVDCPPDVGDTTWGTNRNGVPCDSFYNISRDPIFAVCGEDSFFLSQINAGQLVQSPCMDAGNTFAENLGLHTYTTRTDSIADNGFVDIGYHYPWGITPGVEEAQSSKLKTQNLEVYPNPFTQKTEIRFQIPDTRYQNSDIRHLASNISLKIHDISGRLIREFPINDSQLTTNEVTWDGHDKFGKKVGSGIYFCVLETPDFKQIKKLVILK